MPIEKSAGFVIFKEKDKERFYLLLHYPEGHWDFPKGHIEKGEDLLETAKRELKEETGIENVEVISGFQKTIRYFFKRGKETVLKFVTFFLAKALDSKVKLSFEHQGFKWLKFEEALNLLTFDNAKEVLRSAEEFLIKNEKRD